MQNVTVGSLKSSTAEELERLSTLSVVSNILATSLDFEQLVEDVLLSTVPAFRADRGFIRLFDRAGRVTVERYLDVSHDKSWQPFTFTTTLVQQCRSRRTALLVVDTQQEAETQSVVMGGIRSVMLAPLLIKQELVGVFYLDSLINAACFEANDLKVFSLITDMVSVAVQRDYHAMVIETQSQALEDAQEELNKAAEETILRLSRAAEFRDGETSEHLTRVSLYCRALSKALGLSPERTHDIEIASLLHDVGKLGIPDNIMLKPGRFTDYERQIMQQHTLFGAKILANSQNSVIQLASEIALYHHEKWDGSGYPHGIAGEEIPLPARIAAMADVFDAISSARRYKESYSLVDSFGLLEKESGSHFDPRLVRAFFGIKFQIEQIWSSYQEQPIEGSGEKVEETAATPMPFSLSGALKVLDESPILLAKNSGLKDSEVSRLLLCLEFLESQSEAEADQSLGELKLLLTRTGLSFHDAPMAAKLVGRVKKSMPAQDSSGVLKVVLLDSDPYQREVLSMEATRRGLHAHECSDPQEALRILMTGEADLLVMELADPGAESLLEEVAESHPNLPVVLLTRDGELSRRLSVSGNRNCSYLHKPLPPGAVFDEIEERLPMAGETRTRRTILAFDDDKVVLTVIKRVLQRNGFRVFTASDPMEFWDSLNENAPDLVLLDLEMPSVTGFDICRILRGDAEFRHLPIVVLTAHQEVSEYQRALDFGADDVLSKPLQARRLVTRIKSRLARNRALQLSGSRDPVTGLVQYKFALRMAETLFASSMRMNTPFSVCALKIEGFLQLLDQRGWQYASGLLRQVAELLIRGCRSEDVLTRYKDSMLVLFCPGVSESVLEQRVKSLNAKLLQDKGPLASLRCEARIRTCPKDGTQLKALLERAGVS